MRAMLITIGRKLRDGALAIVRDIADLVGRVRQSLRVDEATRDPAESGNTSSCVGRRAYFPGPAR